MKNASASVVFERLFQVCSIMAPAIVDVLYHSFFEGKLQSLAFHAIGNFVVQKLLQFLPKGRDFEAPESGIRKAFSELVPHIPAFFGIHLCFIYFFLVLFT